MNGHSLHEAPVTALTDPVRQLSDWLQGTDITTLELLGPGLQVRLERQGPAVITAPVPADAAGAPAAHAVRAGSVGVLHLAVPGRDRPLVHAGQAVIEGQPLALLRIGQVLLPVLAPCAGIVARIAAAEGDTVGYGQLLVELAVEPKEESR